MPCEKTISPVSYTHLDVYKRQDCSCLEVVFPNRCGSCSFPLSYWQVYLFCVLCDGDRFQAEFHPVLSLSLIHISWLCLDPWWSEPYVIGFFGYGYQRPYKVRYQVVCYLQADVYKRQVHNAKRFNTDRNISYCFHSYDIHHHFLLIKRNNRPSR